MRKVWTHDIEDESKIPREYMTVDVKRIRDAVRAGLREIPGVRIFQDIQTSFRAN